MDLTQIVVDHGNIIHFMSCRTSCSFSHPLQIPWSLRPSSSSIKWSGPFPPMRNFRFQWSRALNLLCKVALRLSCNWYKRNNQLLIHYKYAPRVPWNYVMGTCDYLPSEALKVLHLILGSKSAPTRVLTAWTHNNQNILKVEAEIERWNRSYHYIR